MLILKAASLLALLGELPPVAAAADLVWVGNDSLNTSNFTNSGNWQNNTLPSWGYGNSLKFNQNQNSNVTGLNYNWGDWRQVNDIYWDTTFTVSRTLSASNGGGIGFKTRIENNSSFTQTVAMEVSGGQDGAADIQLNPVNGSLIFSGTLWNDNSKDYVVWGSVSSTTTTLTLNTALGTNATQANVDFTVSGGRNSAVQVNASQVWAGTTTVNSGAFTTANGVTLASTAIVVGGGTVATSSANTLADSASLTVNSGRLSIGGSDTVASLAGSGGTVNLAAGATLTIGNASSTSYAGSITGSGAFTKVGSGTFTLSGNNTNTGGVALDAGALALGSAGALGSSGTISFGGGTLRSSASNTTDYSGRFSTAAGQQYRIDTNGQNVTLAANLASAGGSLTKLGTGALVLSGSNSYGGGTTVSAGRLAVNGQLGNTAVTVQDGAELGGSGRIAGAVLVAAGGTLAPGNSIESLGAGATTFSGSSTFAYEYDSSAAPAVRGDLLAVSGNLSVASGALISFADLAGASQPFVFGTSLAVINYTGTWDGGYFTYGAVELTNGAEFMVGSQQWQIEYTRASPVGLANFAADYQPGSRFVVITAVPEPSAVVLGIFGLVLGAGLVRRRTTGRSRTG